MSASDMHAGDLTWHRLLDVQGHSHGNLHRPLVVLLPWMWAKQTSTARYVQLFHSLGCDVAVSVTSVPAVWLSSLAARSAVAILHALSTELASNGPRPLLFCAFSGAAKACYCQILRVLHGLPDAPQPTAALPFDPSLLGACMAGQVLDSCPVDFTSAAGVALLSLSTPASTAHSHSPSSVANASSQHSASAAAPGNTLGQVTASTATLSALGAHAFTLLRRTALQPVLSILAGSLDFALADVFEHQRARMWADMDTCAAWPTLLCYSWSGDALAEPHRLHAFADRLRAQCGVSVVPPITVQSPTTTPTGPSPHASAAPTQSAPVRTSVTGAMSVPASSAAATSGDSAIQNSACVVLEQSWEESPHCGHLRAHPAEYEAAVRQWLNIAQTAWLARQAAAVADSVGVATERALTSEASNACALALNNSHHAAAVSAAAAPLGATSSTPLSVSATPIPSEPLSSQDPTATMAASDPEESAEVLWGVQLGADSLAREGEEDAGDVAPHCAAMHNDAMKEQQQHAVQVFQGSKPSPPAAQPCPCTASAAPLPKTVAACQQGQQELIKVNGVQCLHHDAASEWGQPAVKRLLHEPPFCRSGDVGQDSSGRPTEYVIQARSRL